ncbi:MAG: hypothetical protein DMG90_18465 [Acidobacteria bacterium]|jgi:hypothetical protein|nr:MAG: hypothetical protein DMG90_18465 [Acidobacteriota bacterium]
MRISAQQSISKNVIRALAHSHLTQKWLDTLLIVSDFTQDHMSQNAQFSRAEDGGAGREYGVDPVIWVPSFGP